MAEVTVRVQVIADTLLQLLHVRKAAVRFALPDDLAIVGDHRRDSDHKPKLNAPSRSSRASPKARSTSRRPMHSNELLDAIAPVPAAPLAGDLRA